MINIVHMHLISGLMVGIEFPPPDEDETFVMTIDLLFFRIHWVRVKPKD